MWTERTWVSTVGGLVVSQALTLFTTPVIYVYLDRLSSYFSGGGSEPAATDLMEDDEAVRRAASVR